MYKLHLNSVHLCLLTFLLLSCASKKDGARDAGHDHGSGNESIWKEMEDFHMIMAETFHPFKDSANLEPVKSRAGELVAAANEWAAAPVPERVDNRQTRSKLDQLRTEAATLAASVKSGDDEVIGEQLNQLHNTFHEIQESWYRHADH